MFYLKFKVESHCPNEETSFLSSSCGGCGGFGGGGLFPPMSDKNREKNLDKNRLFISISIIPFFVTLCLKVFHKFSNFQKVK